MASNESERISINITVRSDSITEDEAQRLKAEIREVAKRYNASVQVTEGTERTFNRP